MVPAPRSRVRDRRARFSSSLALLASLALAGCASTPQQSTATTAADQVAAETSLQAMLRLAARTESSGNVTAARDIYAKIAARFPEAPAGHLGLGRTNYRSGDPAEAAQHYRRALTYAPGSVDARYGLGKALLAADRPEAAIEQFDRLITQEAADTRPYVAKGVALDMLGRHPDAQTVYRKGLELAPMNVALRTNLGLSLALSGQHKPAIRVLEDAARDPKATARTRQNLALVYGLAGEMDDAAAASDADLGSNAVERNLAYYRALRAARTITDVAASAPTAPQTPEPETDTTQTAEAATDAHSGTDTTGRDQTATPAAPVAEAMPMPLQPTTDAHVNVSDPNSTGPAQGRIVPASFSPNPARDQAIAANAPRYWVQIASLRARPAAKKEWQRLQDAHAPLLADLSPSVQKTEVPDKGTYYRLRSGPFADASRPKQLCQALKARDQACLVVRTTPQS